MLWTGFPSVFVDYITSHIEIPTVKCHTYLKQQRQIFLAHCLNSVHLFLSATGLAVLACRFSDLIIGVELKPVPVALGSPSAARLRSVSLAISGVECKDPVDPCWLVDISGPCVCVPGSESVGGMVGGWPGRGSSSSASSTSPISFNAAETSAPRGSVLGCPSACIPCSGGGVEARDAPPLTGLRLPGLGASVCWHELCITSFNDSI